MASSIHVFVTPRSTVPQQRRFDGLPRRLIGNQAAAIGLAIVLVYMLLALMADLLPLRNPLQIVAVNRLAAPSWSLPLGADTFGRDLLSRVIYGARLSLEVAAFSVALAFRKWNSTRCPCMTRTGSPYPRALPLMVKLL